MAKQINILIVENERVVALNISKRLEEMGYGVAGVVASGEDAIDTAASSRPDLVLMDIRLPGAIDGIQAAEEICTRFGIPVVYLTAYSDRETLQRLKLTQPYGYILKPFEIRQLYSAIEIALYKHQQEQALKAREQWLSTTLKSIGDAVITTDQNGLITFINPVVETLTGWTQEEALGKELSQIFKIIDERTRETAENPVAIALQQGKKVVLGNHTLLISKHGDEIPIDDSAAPIKDEQGTVIGAVLVFHDIIERKRFETELKTLNQELEIRVQERTQELERRQREFIALAENAPDIISRCDRQLRHLYINPVIEQETGIPAQNFIGKTLTELKFPADFIQHWEDCCRDVLATRKPCSTEFSLHGFNGLQFYQALVVPELALDGSIESVLSIVRNITERKQYETKLQASLDEKNVLLKEIHHRVKNNLQTISSLLRLQANSLSDPSVLEILKESQNRVLTMALVHETLYQSPNLAKIDVARYLHRLVGDLSHSHSAGLRNIRVQVDVSHIELAIDLVIPCGLIINELVSNAFNHAFVNDQPGLLIVRFISPEPEQYVLTVQDNGIGLPEELEINKTSSLGLRLVHSLTKQLRGTVEIDRNNGSTFTVGFGDLKKDPTQRQNGGQG